MLYPELEAKIDAGEIMEDDLLWVADFRHADILNKPIRHVPPTAVKLISNDNLPDGKIVYYANYHFRPFGKTGKLLAQVIAPYDNTGYHGLTGTSLNIFLTEDEAKASYVAQSNNVKAELTKARQEQINRFDALIAEVDTRIAQNK